MLTPTTISVAIAFVVLAAYGPCVLALEASMYGHVISTSYTTTVGIGTILIAVIGIGHLAWTRWAPSHSVCLVLLALATICCSVLLGFAINAAMMTTKAMDIAPALTTYQHNMEAFFASNVSRQFNYTESLVGYYGGSNGMPYRPTVTLSDEVFPRAAARAFSEAYCVSEGRHFCSAFPLVQTIVLPGLWNNPNMTAEVKRNLSTLPATLANVIVTASTTLDSFCANVTITYAPNASMNTNLSTYLARMQDPVFKFQKDLYDLCTGCATLATITTKHAALTTWIEDTCPMVAPQSYGVYCLATAKCIASKNKYPTDDDDALCYASWPLTYMNPAYDTCFGDALMSMTRTYEVAIAVASGVLLFFLVLLLAREWVARRTAKQSAMKRDAVAAVTSPVEHA